MGAVVLFDGVCNLCNASVSFIIDRDPEVRIKLAALQSEAGRAALLQAGAKPPEGDPESIVLIEDGHVYHSSTAALRIARHLRGAWPALSVLLLVPRVIRDSVYRFIARNRYRWFGRREMCRVSTPETAKHFL